MSLKPFLCKLIKRNYTFDNPLFSIINVEPKNKAFYLILLQMKKKLLHQWPINVIVLLSRLTRPTIRRSISTSYVLALYSRSQLFLAHFSPVSTPHYSTLSSLTLSHTLSHTYTHTHTHIHIHTHTHTHMLIHIFLSNSPRTHCRVYSLSLSLSHTHMLTHVSLFHSFTLSSKHTHTYII